MRLPRFFQSFKASDHIEEFFVDVSLAQTAELAVKRFEQFIDILLGALHRRQPARVLAGQGFGASAEERDEKIFADEGAERFAAVVGRPDFGEGFGGPRDFGQALLPCGIERQEALAHRFVERARFRAIVKDVHTRVFPLGALFLALDLNLPRRAA